MAGGIPSSTAGSTSASAHSEQADLPWSKGISMLCTLCIACSQGCNKVMHAVVHMESREDPTQAQTALQTQLSVALGRAGWGHTPA